MCRYLKTQCVLALEASMCSGGIQNTTRSNHNKTKMHAIDKTIIIQNSSGDAWRLSYGNSCDLLARHKILTKEICVSWVIVWVSPYNHWVCRQPGVLPAFSAKLSVFVALDGRAAFKRSFRVSLNWTWAVACSITHFPMCWHCQGAPK